MRGKAPLSRPDPEGADPLGGDEAELTTTHTPPHTHPESCDPELAKGALVRDRLPLPQRVSRERLGRGRLGGAGSSPRPQNMRARDAGPRLGLGIVCGGEETVTQRTHWLSCTYNLVH